MKVANLTKGIIVQIAACVRRRRRWRLGRQSRRLGCGFTARLAKRPVFTCRTRPRVQLGNPSACRRAAKVAAWQIPNAVRSRLGVFVTALIASSLTFGTRREKGNARVKLRASGDQLTIALVPGPAKHVAARSKVKTFKIRASTRWRFWLGFRCRDHHRNGARRAPRAQRTFRARIHPVAGLGCPLAVGWTANVTKRNKKRTQKRQKENETRRHRWETRRCRSI